MGKNSGSELESKIFQLPEIKMEKNKHHSLGLRIGELYHVGLKSQCKYGRLSTRVQQS